MTSPVSNHPASDWNTFVRSPVASIDPGRLDACFDNRFGADLCNRLKGSVRLQDRLTALVHRRYALASWVAPEAISAADRAIALAGAEHLMVLARRAGAICWASTIAGAVLTQQVRALHAQLGEELCSFAVAHRDLSAAKRQLEPLDGIAARLDEDGRRCLGAWCHAQPTATGIRVRLKLPASRALDDPPEHPFDEIGPAIVHRAAG
jgi:hypothetical protein